MTRFPNERVEASYWRARRLSLAQDYGIDINDPKQMTEVPAMLGLIARPHELLPYQITEMVAWGRKLAREHNW